MRPNDGRNSCPAQGWSSVKFSDTYELAHLKSERLSKDSIVINMFNQPFRGGYSQALQDQRVQIGECRRVCFLIRTKEWFDA